MDFAGVRLRIQPEDPDNLFFTPPRSSSNEMIEEPPVKGMLLLECTNAPAH